MKDWEAELNRRMDAGDFFGACRTLNDAHVWFRPGLRWTPRRIEQRLRETEPQASLDLAEQQASEHDADQEHAR